VQQILPASSPAGPATAAARAGISPGALTSTGESPALRSRWRSGVAPGRVRV